MRTWLYETLTAKEELQVALGGNLAAAEGWSPAQYLASAQDRIVPRRSESNITSLNLPRPFLIYGLGNNTNEDLAEDNDHEAHRQFFQIWVHDDSGSYLVIDNIINIVKATLAGQSDPASNVTTVRWLENSQEFSNQTYNTIFRYLRFQAIISKGALLQ